MELCQSSGSKCVIRLLFETYGVATSAPNWGQATAMSPHHSTPIT